jgi:DNA (cytosine-5)-methyltransferase 1
LRTLVDVFAGAGLFSAGFWSSGFRPLLAVDADPFAIASYNLNIAGNPGRCSDVGDLIKCIRADVLLAGPPCQGFSSLGPRNPRDRRNILCLAIADWAASTKASIVIVENVPPFLNSAHWRQMAAALARLNYEIETWCLNAADFGTPQQRLRSFTIASKVGLPERPAVKRRVPARMAFRAVRPGDPMDIWPVPTEIATRRIERIPSRGDRRDIMASKPELCPASWFKLGCQVTDVWGRIDPDCPSNTLKSRFQNPSTGRYLHPTENRVISLREGARLQGLPDTWVFSGHREAMARQIGNGVPLPLGEAVAREIARVFERGRRRSKKAA